MIGEFKRVPTGVAGLDIILRGGLIQGSVYLVTGQPGAGKTILGNQVAYAHARAGGKVVYCTLLAETHGRMVANISTFSFFDERLIGEAVTYLEGFGSLDESGLDGAMKLLRGAIRDKSATLLIVDGTVTAENMSPSDVAYKRFMQQLKSWVELVGCTVLLLTSSGAGNDDGAVKPEHTMVDGILQLTGRHVGMRLVRELCVRKFRGCSYLEGFHSYGIDSDGLRVWPRCEAMLAGAQPGPARDEILPLGVAGLDAMLDGGVRRDSVTLVVGATGVGKTTLGLHFLHAGVARGEQGAYFGSFEDPSLLAKLAQPLGLRLGSDDGVSVIWQPDSERVLDALAADLFDGVAKNNARRVVIDGMVAFKTAATDIERLPGFFASLTNELRHRGVTTLFTEQLHDVVNGPLRVPVENIAGNCDNIVFLRQIEQEGRTARLISIVKTRGGRHDRAQRPFDVGATGITVDGGGKRGQSARRGGASRKRRR